MSRFASDRMARPIPSRPDLRYPTMLREAVQGRPFADAGESVMAVPPTIGTVTTATSLGASILRWPASQLTSGRFALSDYFTITSATAPVLNSVNAPANNYVRFTSLTNSTSGTESRYALLNVDFIHDGTAFEVRLFQTSGAAIRVWCDGRLVSANAQTFDTAIGSDGYVLYDFATRAVRHIRIEGASAWGGVVTPLTDTVTRKDLGGPVALVMADSYGEGANAGGPALSFVHRFARRMGWPKTVDSAVGGSGYLNPASSYIGRVKFRDRILNDVVPFAPDLIIWTGGHNDVSYTKQAIQAEALLCYQTIQALLPNTRQIVTAPLWGAGPEGYLINPAVLQVRDALRSAAAAAGIDFLDCLEQPLDYPVTTTLSASTGIGSTSMNLPVVIPPGSYIDIGNRNEYRRVVSVSGGGPFAHVLNKSLARTHTTGDPVVRVGQCLWTGSGNAAAPTADGNSDFLVSNDAVHPTKEGHDVIGDWLAYNVTRLLSAV